MFNITTTQQLKGLQELSHMNEMSDFTALDFEQKVNASYDLFWFGEVSPVIKAQILGTEALKVFTASATAQEIIKTLRALKGEVYEKRGIPEGFELTWAQDGSVVIEEVVNEGE